MRPAIPFLRFVWIACLLLVGVVARAEIRESKEWIVDMRTHRTLTGIADHLGFQDTVISKGYGSAWVSTSGSNFRIVFVGPPSSDPRKYAQAIDAWRAHAGFSGVVNWSNEDNCAAASYSYSAGHFGAHEASTTIDLASLRNTLLPLEPHTQLALLDSAYFHETVGSPPDSVNSTGLKYWDLTRARPGSNLASGAISLPTWLPALLIIWLTLPIVGLFTCLGLAVRAAKAKGKPYFERRAGYRRWYGASLFASSGLYSAGFVVGLFSHVFEPLTQLWFGQPSNQAGPALIPLTMAPMAVLIPFVIWAEKKLIGPSPEDIEDQAPGLPRSVDRAGVWKGRNAYVLGSALFLTVCGFAGMMWADSLDKKASNREPLRLLSIFITYAPLIASQFLIKRPQFVVDPKTRNQTEQDLHEIVQRLATRMEMPAPPSRVLTEAIHGRFGAINDRKGIGVTVQALEVLPTEQVEFLVAHQLANIKLHERQKVLASVIGLPILLTAPCFLWIATHHDKHGDQKQFLTMMLIPVAGMICIGPLISLRQRRSMLAADAMAIKATRNPKAAADAIRTLLTGGVKMPFRGWERGLTARIAAIEKAA